jgi:hypothetical protein
MMSFYIQILYGGMMQFVWGNDDFDEIMTRFDDLWL